MTLNRVLTLNAGSCVFLKMASLIIRGMHVASRSMVPTSYLPVYLGKGEERSGIPVKVDLRNKAIGTKRATYLKVTRERNSEKGHIMFLLLSSASHLQSRNVLHFEPQDRTNYVALVTFSPMKLRGMMTSMHHRLGRGEL